MDQLLLFSHRKNFRHLNLIWFLRKIIWEMKKMAGIGADGMLAGDWSEAHY